jgi:hypothetical protein
MRTSIAAIACALLIFSSYSLASDQESTSFASLPPEAQASIKAALRRDGAIRDFTLTASDGADDDNFGLSVAIDGNTVVVGAPWHMGFTGEAYVFVKPSQGWKNMTQTARLNASDGAAYFGLTVSVSGNTVVVGSPAVTVGGNADQGAAYVFVEPSSGWHDMTETAELTASDGYAGATFGASVAINKNTVLVGAPAWEASGLGSAYIFVEPNGGWINATQTAELNASDGMDGDEFGNSVSISAGTAIVGAPQPNKGAGAAYIFVGPRGGWVNATETAELTASDGIYNDALGTSVSINGNTAAVGSIGGAGAAYVYVRPPSGWSNMTQTAELTPPGAKELGFSVSTNGLAIVIGAPSTGPHSPGAAYVFVEPNGGWKDSSKPNITLRIPFTYGWDNFGDAVSISGKTAVIGADAAPSSPPCNAICAPGPGEAFVFTEQ